MEVDFGTGRCARIFGEAFTVFEEEAVRRCESEVRCGGLFQPPTYMKLERQRVSFNFKSADLDHSLAHRDCLLSWPVDCTSGTPSHNRFGKAQVTQRCAGSTNSFPRLYMIIRMRH